MEKTNNENVNLKGRFIDNYEFKTDIENGKLDGLYKYLKENQEKYNLTYRYNQITLYNSGRGFYIKRKNKGYKLYFNFNNADALLQQKRYKELDDVAKVLKILSFDINKYEAWKEERIKYINMTDEDKTKYKKKHKNKAPDLQMQAFIPANNIEEYSFKTLLDTLHKIFSAYSEYREEENFRDRCISYYNKFDKNKYVVFDVEYKPSFDSKDIKQICKEKYCNMSLSSQFVKPDLMALKKDGDKYKVVFIELKVNVGASVGKSANIVNHIRDMQNYHKLYRNTNYEKESFKKSVLYTIKTKVEKGLITYKGNVDNILNNIDFSEPPALVIACALIRESKEALVNEINSKLAKGKRLYNEIIIQESDDIEILNRQVEKFSDIFDK